MLEKTAYPRITQAVFLLILFALLALVFSILITVLAGIARPGYDMDRLLKHPGQLALANFLAAVIVLVRAYRKTGAPLLEVFPLKQSRRPFLLHVTLAVLGMSMVLSEMDNILQYVLPMPGEYRASYDILFRAEHLGSSFLLLVVVAPIIEELLFRGVILRGFLLNYRVKKAVLVSTLLFGVIHLNPWQFPGAVVTGIFFAWYVVKSHSLLPCLFGHALNNALPLLFLYLFNLKIPGYNLIEERVIFQPLWFTLTGFVLMGSGIYLAWKGFARDTQEQQAGDG